MFPESEAIRVMLISILNDEFAKVRYETPHLERLFAIDPELETRWKQNTVIDLGDYTLEETDDWKDLLLIGTEVWGSCQSVYTDWNTNLSLVGFMFDGMHKAVVLRDKKTKRIVARYMTRLLYDRATNKPVFMTEKIYRASPSPIIPQEFHDYPAQIISRCNIEKVSEASEDLLYIPHPMGIEGYVDSEIFKKEGAEEAAGEEFDLDELD